MIDGVVITAQKIIEVPGGDVLHAMKSSDQGFCGFGEAYFSTVEPDAIKAWKRHQEMVLNLVVPVGAVKFVLFDDRPDSATSQQFQEVTLSRENYNRLTVPPMVWTGFQGVSQVTSILLNVANIEHQPTEADRLPLNEINYEWES